MDMLLTLHLILIVGMVVKDREDRVDDSQHPGLSACRCDWILDVSMGGNLVQRKSCWTSLGMFAGEVQRSHHPGHGHWLI